MRQGTGPKNVVAQLVEEVRSAAEKREGVDRVAAVIQLPAHLHDHPLVDVEPGLGDLRHHGGRLARIDEAKPADGSWNAHGTAVGAASGTLPVVNQENLASRAGGMSLAAIAAGAGTMGRTRAHAVRVF